MSTRPALAAAANPRPLPPLAQRVPPAARRLGAVLRAGALERERAQLGADTGFAPLPLVAGGAMAGKILFDYHNMPDDVLGRTAWQRHQARWLVDQDERAFTLIDQLNLSVTDGRMSIEAANAILNQLSKNVITSVEGYVAYAERTGGTNNHFYHKLKCWLDPDGCPPIPPPLRPQYSDYGAPSPPRAQYSGYGSPIPPPLRPQSSAQDSRLR